MFNPTIARITARALIGRRRFLLLLPLPLLLVGLALLPDSLGAAAAGLGASRSSSGLGLAVVLPVIALIVGTGVLGSEIDDGTLAHILAKPLPRREIVISKLRGGVRDHRRHDRRAAGRGRPHRRIGPAGLGTRGRARRWVRSRTARCSPRSAC